MSESPSALSKVNDYNALPAVIGNTNGYKTPVKS